MNEDFVIWWCRRDMRLDDNAALFHALTSGKKVLPLFIFDKNILDELPAEDARVNFIHDRLGQLHGQLLEMGSSFLVYYGLPEEVWKQIMAEQGPFAVYTNHDYEPYARKRDAELKEYLNSKGVDFHTYKDQVIFEKEEVLTDGGTPYSVFTPYSRKWKAGLNPDNLRPFDSESHFGQFLKTAPKSMPSLGEMGFKGSSIPIPSIHPDEDIIKDYHEMRNFPAIKGTTRIGIHLRFGTISIRKLAISAWKLNETYLNELIWREFYMQILWNFPHVAKGPFREKYAAVPWRDEEEEFEKWCKGQTGYPIVDAGMRELNETGFMHNRSRMIVASFLSKHLLINWQWGEKYFATKLLDFELASNNGGWQWAAGSGTDAAPYFRIFNPESQMKKFDKELKYVRKWVPEFGTPAYPRPIVEHKAARERCLNAYKLALGKA
ncbi:MAG: DNA photolyase family protein [Bacteroidia bacterium]|nr:DNA photolyase family protein [Bacteroidia bacterium]